MKTMVIVGAGMNLGLSLAKRFGREGFQIVLIARNREKLQKMVQELESMGIQASYYVADISNEQQLAKAFTEIKARYGKIDVVEFSPLTWDNPPAGVLEMKPENVHYQFENQVMPAINVVNEVVPDMISSGSGTLMFTTGVSAFQAIPALGDMGIALSGLRNYINNLSYELSQKGIPVIHRSIATVIEKGKSKESDPDTIADMMYQAYEKGESSESIYPEPAH